MAGLWEATLLGACVVSAVSLLTLLLRLAPAAARPLGLGGSPAVWGCLSVPVWFLVQHLGLWPLCPDPAGV